MISWSIVLVIGSEKKELYSLLRKLQDPVKRITLYLNNFRLPGKAVVSGIIWDRRH